MASTAVPRQELVSIRDVSFSYDGPPVIEHVTFNIFEGDFLAILGPNGSGKTTLLKITLGLLKPERGEIRIMGKPAPEFDAWHEIGYVPQKATHIDPFFPASVKEVVAMALLSHKTGFRFSKRQEIEAVRNALGQVDMEPYENRPIGGLSGGQQQRVFIARALVTRPRILFLDEPTTGVDSKTKERFYEMLGRLNLRQGLTIVQVTHDTGIVNKHIRQVACLNQRLTYHGTHEDFCRSGVLEDMLAGGHHLVSHEH
ncbi:MAG: metal ABC transporter ATP-binding protein [Acidobacteriota bacterium]|nr:metal ABC transporter ATP-binding protein [Acidobacteriota bacterium]